MSCGVPGRPAGCDSDRAPSGFKCVTGRARTGTNGHRESAPAATGAIPLLPRVPAAIVTMAQPASGPPPERARHRPGYLRRSLGHVARCLGTSWRRGVVGWGGVTRDALFLPPAVEARRKESHERAEDRAKSLMHEGEVQGEEPDEKTRPAFTPDPSGRCRAGARTFPQMFPNCCCVCIRRDDVTGSV